ncbi:MAG: hypothetical protein ACE5KO_03930 [Candidatus Bathyarchaeia archaeon]
MAEELEQQTQSAAQPPVPRGYRGTYRILKIQPSAVSIDDLRRLYTRLSEKTSEALEAYLNTINPQPGQDPQQLDNLKNDARKIGGLTVIIIGANGEQIVNTHIDALSQDDLPDKITSIAFDSSSALKGFNVALPNSFRLNLDFTEPPGFHTYDPWDQPTPNNSNLEVSGPNTTWVSGVYETVVSFFRERKRNRAWLHSQVTFNILNWLFAFPAALWITYRIDNIFQSQLQNVHVTLRGALYVYIVLVSLLAFRVIVAGFRWIFPVLELQGARSKKVRDLLGTILGSLLLALLYDILKAIIK